MSWRAKSVVSLIVWLGAAAAAAWLWLRVSPRHQPLPAEVMEVVHRVGPDEPGRLAELRVAPGDEVAAGQLLARLDVADIDAELAVARSELIALTDAVHAETQALHDELAERRLEAATELAKAKAHLAELGTRRAGSSAELKTVSEQLTRLDGALRDGLTQVDRLTELRARERMLAAEAALHPKTARAWRELSDRITGALEALDDERVQVRVRPLVAQVEAQQRRVEALMTRRARRALYAPVDGRVRSVLQWPGDPVLAGATLIEVVPTAPPIVLAYDLEMAGRAMRPGDAVEVATRAGGVRLPGVVDRLGPAVIELPLRYWQHPDRPVFGRPVFVHLSEGARDLVPGEAVDVRFIGATPGTAIAAPREPSVQAVKPPADTPSPVLLGVPDALWAKSRFEPSGAVWLPERQRFLVVSDDTGADDGDDEHLPWVFLADAAGRVDPEPLAIEGAPRLSDLEAVARHPNGDLWLVCSQSRSAKGKRPDKRKCLVRARVAEGRLVATGVTQLYDALVKALSPDQQAALGIGPDLDIEGMTWHEGELLLGLKAPLDPEGRARIWRVRHPERVFEHGFGPNGAAVELFGAVLLPTGADGMPGGIADLVHDGDALRLTSTLPEGPDVGVAWRVPLPLGARPPERIARWPGLKAEGLALGPDGWWVFFDADPPRWVRLP